MVYGGPARFHPQVTQHPMSASKATKDHSINTLSRKCRVSNTIKPFNVSPDDTKAKKGGLCGRPFIASIQLQVTSIHKLGGHDLLFTCDMRGYHSRVEWHCDDAPWSLGWHGAVCTILTVQKPSVSLWGAHLSEVTGRED